MIIQKPVQNPKDKATTYHAERASMSSPGTVTSGCSWAWENGLKSTFG